MPVKTSDLKKDIFSDKPNPFEYNPNLTVPKNNNPKKINGTPIDNISIWNENDNEYLNEQFCIYPDTYKTENKKTNTENLNKENNNNNIENNINNNIDNNVNNNIDNNIDNVNNNINNNVNNLNNENEKENKNDSDKIDYNDIIIDIFNTKNQNKNNFKNRTKKVYNINTQFKKNIEDWPKTTQIHCFWDSHPFNNIPISIPLKIDEDNYHLYGCFCSLECAAAYIFKNYKNKWELYSLLHNFYNQDKKIKIASPRETLAIFGGSLDILKYRSVNSCNNISYSILMPPYLPIVPIQKEENCNNKNNYKYIPIDKEKINKADESLRLKRKKPINKNVLEMCMNLKYNK